MALVSTAAKGSSSGGGGAVLLNNVTLGVNGNFDIQNISQAYSDLIIILIARSAAVTAADALNFRLNNDAGATNYQYVGTNESSIGTIGGYGATGAAQYQCGTIPGASDGATLYGGVWIEIIGYTSTTWAKTIKSNAYYLQSFGGVHQHLNAAGQWNGTAAVNRFTTLEGGGPLLAGSWCRIYGR